MSEFMADLGGVLGTHQIGNQTVTVTQKGSNLDLDMTDFITLMITQMTNQGIDDTMDTSEMLNQMVQMQMVTALANMTDATLMSYSASLVGKEVTVGKYGDDGKLQEIVGTVTGTGTMDGQQVVFVNDEYYYLSDIMAVGRLPQDQDSEDSESTEEVEGTDKPEGTEGSSGTTETPSETETDDTTVTETPEYSGENGAPQDSEG